MAKFVQYTNGRQLLDTWWAPVSVFGQNSAWRLKERTCCWGALKCFLQETMLSRNVAGSLSGYQPKRGVFLSQKNTRHWNVNNDFWFFLNVCVVTLLGSTAAANQKQKGVNTLIFSSDFFLIFYMLLSLIFFFVDSKCHDQPTLLRKTLLQTLWTFFKMFLYVLFSLNISFGISARHVSICAFFVTN